MEKETHDEACGRESGVTKESATATAAKVPFDATPSITRFTMALAIIYLFLGPFALAEGNIKETRGRVQQDDARVCCVAIAFPMNATREARETQLTILQSLPKDVGAIVISDHPHPFRKQLEREFSSGRFLRLNVSKLASTWVRDYFPKVVRRGDGQDAEPWLFALTAKYPADRHVSLALADASGYRLQQHPLAGEWGNIMIDPETRTAFTTDFWMSQDPPNVGRRARKSITQTLRRELDVERVVWLPSAKGTLASFHLDLMAKIVPDRNGFGERLRNVVFVSDSSNPKFKRPLDLAAARFTREGYDVVRLMNAEAADQENCAFSYANTTLVNNVAFVPQYAPPRSRRRTEHARTQARLDRKAVKAFGDMGYEVVPVPARKAARLWGSVHCLTAVITDQSLMQELKKALHGNNSDQSGYHPGGRGAAAGK